MGTIPVSKEQLDKHNYRGNQQSLLGAPQDNNRNIRRRRFSQLDVFPIGKSVYILLEFKYELRKRLHRFKSFIPKILREGTFKVQFTIQTKL
jgi:hypothetical protein